LRGRPWAVEQACPRGSDSGLGLQRAKLAQRLLAAALPLARGERPAAAGGAAEWAGSRAGARASLGRPLLRALALALQALALALQALALVLQLVHSEARSRVLRAAGFRLPPAADCCDRPYRGACAQRW
jgi:hypothetical protein